MAAAFDLDADVQVNFESDQGALELAHRLVEIGFRELHPLDLALGGLLLLRSHQLLGRKVLLDLSLVHALRRELSDLLLTGYRLRRRGGVRVLDEDLTEKKHVRLLHVALLEDNSL